MSAQPTVSENPRIGILDSGFIINDCHLPAYRKLGFNPVAIASRTKTNAQAVAESHGRSETGSAPAALTSHAFCLAFA